MIDIPWRSILLVEDDHLIAMFEKNCLEKVGCIVTIAHSGEQAVRKVHEHSGFDLVLMDIDLGGGMDGFRTTEEMLSIRHVAILFLSSHTDEDYLERARHLTPLGCAQKDLAGSALLKQIEQAYGAHCGK